jgi:hypothetical protein
MTIETEAMIAQTMYCLKMGVPQLAPSNGHCQRCGKNIYSQYKIVLNGGKVTGYTVDYASNYYIKNCPHCNESFKKSEV